MKSSKWTDGSLNLQFNGIAVMETFLSSLGTEITKSEKSKVSKMESKLLQMNN